MKILLTGASGQLGQELYRSLGGLGTVTQVDRALGPGSAVLTDLSDLNAVAALLENVQPDVVVNAAAYTAVDQAEEAGRAPFCLNALLPERLARWCALNDSLLLHYSTDYVFDGQSSRPYREQDPTGPLNAYGESKLAGEWAVAASGCRHLVLRTSWLYSAHGNNFVLTMLNLARQRQELSIVQDQSGCPTWARNLANVSARLLARVHDSGTAQSFRTTLHYCDADATTWYDFASMILKQAVALGLLPAVPRLKPIASAEFQQRARRPAYSVLDTMAIQSTFGIEPCRLTASLRACMEEISP